MDKKYINAYTGKGNKFIKKQNIRESFPAPAAVSPEQEVLTLAAA